MPYNFQRQSLRRAARMVDLAIVSTGLVAAMIVTAASFSWPDIEAVLAARIKVINLLQLIGYLAVCSVVFSLLGFYRAPRPRPWPKRVSVIALAVLCMATTLLLLRVPLHLSFATDRFLAIFSIVCFAGLIVTHELSRTLQKIARLQGKNFRNVVIIADDPRGRELAARIERQANLGYRVVRVITPQDPGV